MDWSPNLLIPPSQLLTAEVSLFLSTRAVMEMTCRRQFAMAIRNGGKAVSTNGGPIRLRAIFED